jgi:hypothetical protein
MVFIRALYCVDSKLRRLRGLRAKQLACSTTPSRFRQAHPVLFNATGFAHHPYQLLTAPDVKPIDKDVVTMAVLSRLTKTLDKVFRRYGTHRRIPLYLTEFGYQTPPDPLGVPLLTQGAFLNQSEWMTFRNPRIKTLAQFLLVDDGSPIKLTFQSGLMTRKGAFKPSFPAYRLPVWLTGGGSRKRVWAVFRPAPAGSKAQGVIQYRPKNAKAYKTIKIVTSRGLRNVVSTVTAPKGGSLRVVYGPFVSRTVRVK